MHCRRSEGYLVDSVLDDVAQLGPLHAVIIACQNLDARNSVETSSHCNRSVEEIRSRVLSYSKRSRAWKIGARARGQLQRCSASPWDHWKLDSEDMIAIWSHLSRTGMWPWPVPMRSFSFRDPGESKKSIRAARGTASFFLEKLCLFPPVYPVGLVVGTKRDSRPQSQLVASINYIQHTIQ